MPEHAERNAEAMTTIAALRTLFFMTISVRMGCVDSCDEPEACIEA
jgi:hypothetical protein